MCIEQVNPSLVSMLFSEDQTAELDLEASDDEANLSELMRSVVTALATAS